MQLQNDTVSIENLLKRASEFAALSVTNVISKLDDGQATPREVFYDCQERMHELEVHFLFPNLSSVQRDLLVRLLNARRALATRLGQTAQYPSARGATRQDPMLTQFKRRFVELEGRAERLAEDVNLTASQKQILKREFLGLPTEI